MSALASLIVHRVVARAKAGSERGEKDGRIEELIEIADQAIADFEAAGSPQSPCPECEARARADGDIHAHSLVSHRDGTGRVHLAWGRSRAQLDPDEVRAHALGLLEVAEAAEMDAAVTSYLVAELHLDLKEAVSMVGRLRAHRAAGKGRDDA